MHLSPWSYGPTVLRRSRTARRRQLLRCVKQRSSTETGLNWGLSAAASIKLANKVRPALGSERGREGHSETMKDGRNRSGDTEVKSGSYYPLSYTVSFFLLVVGSKAASKLDSKGRLLKNAANCLLCLQLNLEARQIDFPDLIKDLRTSEVLLLDDPPARTPYNKFKMNEMASLFLHYSRGSPGKPPLHPRLGKLAPSRFPGCELR